MKNFKKFTSNSVEMWIDINEITGVMQARKEVRGKKWYSKGYDVWVVYFYHKSGYRGHLVCWCEELADNYVYMLMDKTK